MKIHLILISIFPGVSHIAPPVLPNWNLHYLPPNCYLFLCGEIIWILRYVGQLCNIDLWVTAIGLCEGGKATSPNQLQNLILPLRNWKNIPGRLYWAGSKALWGQAVLQIGKIRFESFLWEVAFPPSLGNIPLTNAIIIK